MDTLAPGSKIGPFRIVGKIAEGGMGEIYEGIDDELNRRLAIKILAPAALREADGLPRFKSEARTLARINHPNVVQVHLCGESEGVHFMALEFLDGTTLDSYLTRHSPNILEILKFFRQMTEGLLAAHEQEIVHRDIKPQNVMITSSGVKLVDFGIAKAQTDHDSLKTSMGIVVGTRNFLAPEILKGSPATKQGDIYSLGLTLKFMVTGELPTSAEGAARLPTGKTNLLYPPALTTLLTGMLQPLPNMRFRDLKEVVRALNQVNFNHFPPELLAEIPNGAAVANLEKLIMGCRACGLDVTEARMAVNLSAKTGARTPEPQESDSNKTEFLDLKKAADVQVTEVALGQAIARVKRAKVAALSGRTRTPETTAVTPKHEAPISILQFLVIVLLLVLSAKFCWSNREFLADVFTSVFAGSRSPASTP